MLHPVVENQALEALWNIARCEYIYTA